ncbi:MAG: hypothetical protein ACPLRH_00100 [Desulfotomaculales bacterium]
MLKYRVIAEFVDLEAKKRRFPGETVEAPLERAKILIEKGVIYPAPLEEAQKEPLEEAQKETNTEPAEEPGKEDSEATDEKPGKSKRK